jgi:predicted Zn-dependent protease
MGEGGASGWGSFLGRDAGTFLPAQLGSSAATLAERSAGAGDLEPGTYTVVLAPEAVADILDFLGYLGFGAKAFAEGSSFLVNALGTRVADTCVSIYDDALSPATIGISFDYEGQPRRRTPLIEGGVAIGPVTDSYFAAKLDRPDTGHALPAPNPYGPLPLNIEMQAGDATLDEMIGSVRNLRFTQSVLSALSDVRAIGSKRQLCGGEGGAVLAPALLIGHWAFTGQTG